MSNKSDVPYHSEKNVPLSEMWKVPFRQVYCLSFRSWLAQTIYCHVVLKLDPIRDCGGLPV